MQSGSSPRELPVPFAILPMRAYAFAAAVLLGTRRDEAMNPASIPPSSSCARVTPCSPTAIHISRAQRSSQRMPSCQSHA